MRLPCRIHASWLIVSIGCLLAANSFAQLSDRLPQAPEYHGEIRRGADGRLKALPQSEAGPNSHVAVVVLKATMVVGRGEKISTLTEAARLARDGEVIEVRSGDYRGQPVVWTQDNLIVRGVGARPVMWADGTSAEGKAIWVVRGGNVRIENVEFRGARVPAGNGAGIRFEKGHLTVHGCRFADNEMGILTANAGDMSLAVSDSEFVDAPRHAGALHHLLYVGAIGKFSLRGSRFGNGYLGHLVKSRARENHVLYNMMADGADGRSSYELEFPNGGVAYVIGNVIAQSAVTDNPSIVSYGAEGQRWPDNALYLAHNTLVNDFHAGTFLSVANDRFVTEVEVWGINNLLVGHGNYSSPGRGRFEGNRPASPGELIEYGGLPLRLTATSPLRGSVRMPGSAAAVDLLPRAEFTYPSGSRPIHIGSALSPGAFQ